MTAHVSVHTPQDPTHENGWASWWCPQCGTDSASDNPCDCCDDADALARAT